MRGEVREIGPEKMVATKIDKQFLPNGHIPRVCAVELTDCVLSTHAAHLMQHR